MPWGTPVRIDFTREKITLPTPKCSFKIVVPKVIRTTATILAWLRTESLRATKNKQLFNFAQSEMLSRNNRPFLDKGTTLCLTILISSCTKIFLFLRHHNTQTHSHVQQPNQTNQLNIARYRKAVSTAIWLQLTMVACYLPHGVASVLVV